MLIVIYAQFSIEVVESAKFKLIYFMYSSIYWLRNVQIEKQVYGFSMR